MQFSNHHDDGTPEGFSPEQSNEDAVWDSLLDPAQYAVPRAKARPNKFLAIGLHFYEGIRAARG